MTYQVIPGPPSAGVSTLEVFQSAQAMCHHALGRCRIRGGHLEAMGEARNDVQFCEYPGGHQPACILDVLVPQDVDITDVDVTVTLIHMNDISINRLEIGHAADSRALVMPKGPSVSNVARVAATCSSTVVGLEPPITSTRLFMPEKTPSR